MVKWWCTMQESGNTPQVLNIHRSLPSRSERRLPAHICRVLAAYSVTFALTCNLHVRPGKFGRTMSNSATKIQCFTDVFFGLFSDWWSRFSQRLSVIIHPTQRAENGCKCISLKRQLLTHRQEDGTVVLNMANVVAQTNTLPCDEAIVSSKWNNVFAMSPIYRYSLKNYSPWNYIIAIRTTLKRASHSSPFPFDWILQDITYLPCTAQASQWPGFQDRWCQTELWSHQLHRIQRPVLYITV